MTSRYSPEAEMLINIFNSMEARYKTFLQITFSFLLVTHIIFAQQDYWQFQGGPYGKYIRSISTGLVGDVYISVNDGSLLRSKNNGELWTMTDYNHSLIQAITIDSTGRIYTGTSDEGIFRSSDEGANWQQISNGLNCYNILSITKSLTGAIYCGSDGGGVYVLTNNDTSWQYLGLANVAIMSLLVNSNGYIYAGTSGYSVFRSTNGGNEWAILEDGIGENRIINSLAIDTSGTIYAGTDLGVYRSTNDGDMWFQSNSGLMDTVVYELAVTPSRINSCLSRSVYVCIFGWRGLLGTTSFFQHRT